MTTLQLESSTLNILNEDHSYYSIVLPQKGEASDHQASGTVVSWPVSSLQPRTMALNSRAILIWLHFPLYTSLIIFTACLTKPCAWLSSFLSCWFKNCTKVYFVSWLRIFVIYSYLIWWICRKILAMDIRNDDEQYNSRDHTLHNKILR